jgi:hypothetical protein
MKNEKFTAQKIRSEYVVKESTKVEELKALDSKVRKPANIFSYVFGSVSAIVMGAGMSLVMTDVGAKIGIANALVPGIIIGVIGLALAIVNYPVHKALMKSRRKKYADKIIALTDSIINEQ